MQNAVLKQFGMQKLPGNSILSTRLNEKLEKIQQILKELSLESESGKLIVVEGKKDVETLRALGIQGKIIAIKTGGKTFSQSMLEIEQTGPSEVVFLFDFDRRGKQATKYFKQNLEIAGIKPNLRFYNFLHALIGREIQCIESLTSYLDTLQQKAA
jgi:5S rRNA maturation endonuclease (ribonuclease M5)